MERKIISTKDNSKTLLIPELNETYHSTNGALIEAEHIFIKNGLLQKIDFKEKINIFEVGFGTGLNALLTLKYSDKNKLKVNYVTIEKYPVDALEVLELDYCKITDSTLYKSYYNKMHSTKSDVINNLKPNFSFSKYLKCIKTFQPGRSKYDIIYFDAFAPSHQPLLWSKEVLLKMYNALVPGGFLITYCAQGQFKRDLKTIGFEVKPLEGPPGKREITKAIKL
jgi:tRNA U34 5-methylaminomethyl-2-thiouridine-forming methyltransferase MnmC